MGNAMLDTEVLSLDGFPVWVELMDYLAKYEDERGNLFEAPSRREAAVSILSPDARPLDETLGSRQYEAALALVTEAWETTYVSVVHAGDRESADRREVTGRHENQDGRGCVDVIVLTTPHV